MIKNLKELFDKHKNEYLKFDRVQVKRSTRRDINAFILLNQLCPDTNDIIAAAYHDEIGLSVEPVDFSKVASEADVIELIRCGVSYDTRLETFTMIA